MTRILAGMGVSAPMCTALLLTGTAHAQSAAAPAKANHNQYVSPLDTLKSTRLWTEVPPARDFVRDSRPDPKQLDYTPLTSHDPERPKPRDKANVEALQAELEHDRTINGRKMDRPRQSRAHRGSDRQVTGQ